MADQLRAFPETAQQALAMLYVQSQDLTGKTPADLQTMYYEALYQIRHDHAEKTKSGWFKTQQDTLR